MTIELERIVKNLNNNIISVELYQENDTVKLFIGDDTSSGCEYSVQSVQDVIDRVQQYLYSYNNEI